jgi:hypothetical protein
MCQTDLWNLNKVHAIFSVDLPLPAPVIGQSTYNKMTWTEKYDGAAFLSIDIKEANLSALQIMARLTDAELFKKISCGWDSFIEDVLGGKADIVRGSKTFRQVVLGTLERAWLRRQDDLSSVVDEVMLQQMDGATFVARATTHDADSVGLAQSEVAACQKTYKKLSAQISHAYEAVEKVVVKKVASVVASMVSDIQVFAIVADEVVFSLPSGITPTEVDRILHSVSKAVEAAFCEEYRDLADLFRLEAFMPVSLGSGAVGTGWALAAPTRRFHSKGVCETFVKVKGVPRDMSETDMETLSGLLHAKRNCCWDSWLSTATTSRKGGA